jgi:hypothetical protein
MNMERKKLIDGIVELEWNMFTNVPRQEEGHPPDDSRLF